MSENRVEIVYFRKKLGISFKIVDGNVSVVGAAESGITSPSLQLADVLQTKKEVVENYVKENSSKTVSETNSTKIQDSNSAIATPTVLNSGEASNQSSIMGTIEEGENTTVYLGASSTYGELSFVGSEDAIATVATDTTQEKTSPFTALEPQQRPSIASIPSVPPSPPPSPPPVVTISERSSGNNAVSDSVDPTHNEKSDNNLPTTSITQPSPQPSSVPLALPGGMRPPPPPPPSLPRDIAPPPPPPRKPSGVITTAGEGGSSSTSGSSELKSDVSLKGGESSVLTTPSKATENLKVLVESEHFFGAGIKKILKTTTTELQTNSSITVSTVIDNLKNKIVSTFSLPSSHILLFYFDDDVSDFALLDDLSWEEFITQNKKNIRVTEDKNRTPPPIPPITPTISATITTVPEDRISNELSNLSILLPEEAVSSKSNGGNAYTPSTMYGSVVCESGLNSAAVTPGITPGVMRQNSNSSSSRIMSVRTPKSRRLKNMAVSPNMLMTNMQRIIHNTLFQSPVASIMLGQPINNNQSILNDSAGISDDSHRLWFIGTDEPSAGSIVLYINGVKISGLDKDFQLALVKQKNRPLLLEYQLPQPHSLSSTGVNSSETTRNSEVDFESSSVANNALITATDSMKQSFFLSKYNHSTAFKLRQKTEKLIQDYKECDWAAAKKEGTGLPYATITSVYRYIESELIKLDLFNNKRSRGAGAPDDLTEPYLCSLREHIESLVFKLISVHTKTLWPVFSEDSRAQYIEYDESESAKHSDLTKGDKFIDIDITGIAFGDTSSSSSSNANIESEIHSRARSGSGAGTATAGSGATNIITTNLSVVSHHNLIPLPHTFSSQSLDGVIGSSSNSTDDLNTTVTELSSEHTLHMKLSYLRFITLENLGVVLDPTATFSSGNNNLPGSTSISRQTSCSVDSSDGNTENTARLPAVSDGGISKSVWDEVETAHPVAEETKSGYTTPFASPKRTHSSSSMNLKSTNRNNDKLNNNLCAKEEWYLAMKGLCRAMQFETPGEILARLVSTAKLISHALDAQMNHKLQSDAQLCCGSCGNIHVKNSDGEWVVQANATANTTSGSASVPSTPISSTSHRNRSRADKAIRSLERTTCLICKHTTLSDVTSAVSTTENNLESCPKGENDGDNPEDSAHHSRHNSINPSFKSQEYREISADDLMPAITWVLIQSNPPNIEYILWLCTEYRHPQLLMGEEAYYLAQLSSAIEFVREAKCHSFDISRANYNYYMLRYNNTLKLLIACKTGKMKLVQSLLNNPTAAADVNGRTPDNKDIPLTACIKFNQMQIFEYLLLQPSLNVDTPINLFYGPNQRSTALMIASEHNAIQMLLLLLAHGANRHHSDDSGNSALSIAVEKEHYTTELILEADPLEIDLVDVILGLHCCEHPYDSITVLGTINTSNSSGSGKSGDHRGGATADNEDTEKLVAGLLMQSVEVNYLASIPSILVPSRTDKNKTATSPPLTTTTSNLELSLSPLFAAILSRQIEIIRLLFTCQDTDIDVNYCNIHGENALIALVKEFIAQPSRELIVMAAMLLRAGCDRTHRDETGYSALQYLTEMKTPRSSVIVVSDEHTTTNTATKNKNNTNSNDNNDKDSVLLSIVGPDLTTELRHLLQYDPLRNTAHKHLHEIVKNGDYYGAKALLYQGVNVNIICPQKGYTALIAAVYNRDIHMLELLVKSNELYELTESHTPSHWFSELNYEDSYDNAVVEECPSNINSNSRSNSAKLVRGDSAANLYSNNSISNTPGTSGGYNNGSSSKSSTMGARNVHNNTINLNLAGRGGMSALHYAAQLGDTVAVGRLLQYGAQRTVLNDKNHSPLDVAIANGHVETANALKFDPVSVSICLAAKHGDWIVMNALLVQGISINTTRQHVSGKGIHHELYTPLIAATAHGQSELVKQIVDAHSECDVNQVNLIGQTALMYAAARGDEPTVLKLLSCGADRWIKDLAGNDAAYWAENRGFATLAVLLRHDPMRIFIHDVIRKNDFTAVVSMLKQNVSPNLKRVAVFMMLPPSVDVTPFLTPPPLPATPYDAGSSSGTGSSISSDAKVSTATGTSTTAPVTTKNAAASAMQFTSPHKQAADLGLVEGETPLIVAAKYNRLEVLALLLKCPEIEINGTDSQGWTALFHAAASGHEEAVLLLIKAGVSRSALDKHGKSAQSVATASGKMQIAAIIEADPYCCHIHDMCQKGKLLMVNALLKQGCPPNYKDERMGLGNQTPLMAACSGGQADVVRMLLRAQSVVDDKDFQDSKGLTALMRAARAGALDCTALLLNAGADRTLKDKEGLTARDHAARHSYTVMFQFISQNMVR